MRSRAILLRAARWQKPRHVGLGAGAGIVGCGLCCAQRRGDQSGHWALPCWQRKDTSADRNAVDRNLTLVLDRFAADKRHAANCASSLAIEDLKTLRKGLGLVKRLGSRARGRGEG